MFGFLLGYSLGLSNCSCGSDKGYNPEKYREELLRIVEEVLEDIKKFEKHKK